MIKPLGFGGREVEKFEEYLPKAKKELPKFPNCVIEQWVYRHFNDFIDFDRINFEQVEFKLIKMNLKEVNDKIDSKITKTLLQRGNELYTNNMRKETRLGKYMLTNKKRPKPVIITQNSNLIQKKFNTDNNKSFFLIEGHMRLAYMKEIYKKEELNIDQDIRLMNIKNN